MKIGRFIGRGETDTHWGVLDEERGVVRELRGPIDVWAPELAMAEGPPDQLLGAERPLVSLQPKAPLAGGARVFAIGINYAKHVAGISDLPSETPGFMKPASAIVDPGGVCRFPPHHEQLDYEVELVAVLAKSLDQVKRPIEALLGYTIGNDGSVRDVARPLGGIDFYSMKAQDGFSPVGPWIATLSDLGGFREPDLEMSTYVNGELRQKDRTCDMMFPVEWILSYINERNILQAGDLVFTGTISGTAADAGYPWLQAGDRLRMRIERIGDLEFQIGPKPASSPSAVQRREAMKGGSECL
jgi:2-keto-4-pentenoate hydratase/2-oxohepta-3-ene-1,7-dioic acid hydratase in catechol pathway